MPAHQDKRSAHVRIAAELRAQIMDGELAPGEPLPSNGDLATRFGVAGTTIQDAIKTLATEGYLETSQGTRRRVRQRPPAVLEVEAYFVPDSAGISYEILNVRAETPPAFVRAVLGEETAVLRRRRMLVGGEPAELNHAWYPASIANGSELTRNAKIKGGVPRVLAELGFPQRRMVDQVSSRLPTTDEFEALELSAGIPVIRQFRVIYSDGDRPVEVAVMIKAGHLFELRYSSIPLD